MEAGARQEFQRLSRRVEASLEEIETLPSDRVREVALDGVQAVLDLHAAALQQVLRLAGDEVAERLAGDEVVSGLLLLHGLHPRSLAERVDDALREVAPYLASHGGGLEVLGLDQDGLRLRLKGHCEGCPSSQATLRGTVEEALARRAPDLPGLTVEGIAEAAPAAGASFVAVEAIARPRNLAWQDTGPLTEAVEVRVVDGTPVLLCSVRGDGDEPLALAYRDRCPGCGQSLGGSSLEAALLTCGSCGRVFDVRGAGRAVDGGRGRLEPVPLLPDGAALRLQVPSTAALAGGRG